MFSISKFAMSASLIVCASAPALAHPGHGPDNPILHRVVHWASGVDPALAALVAGVLALVAAAALWVRSRDPINGKFLLDRRRPILTSATRSDWL